MKFSIENQEGMGLSIDTSNNPPRSPRSAVQAVTCTIQSFQQSLLTETEQEQVTSDGKGNREALLAPDSENPLQDAGQSQLNAKTGPTRHTRKGQFVKPGFIDACSNGLGW
jgi:hypothetical protein